MKLKLGSNCTKIFENSPGCYSLSENKHVNGGRDTITGCPNISFLTVNCHLSGFTHVLDQSIIGMKKLSSLDLTDSDVDMNYMHSLRFLPCLQILILHNVQLENENLFSIFTIISRIKTLRYEITQYIAKYLVFHSIQARVVFKGGFPIIAV